MARRDAGSESGVAGRRLAGAPRSGETVPPLGQEGGEFVSQGQAPAELSERQRKGAKRPAVRGPRKGAALTGGSGASVAREMRADAAAAAEAAAKANPDRDLGRTPAEPKGATPRGAASKGSSRKGPGRKGSGRRVG